MKRYVHEMNDVELINKSLDASSDVEQFELVDRKPVRDFDGFYTDYSLYYDVLNDRYVTVFGDSDFYSPEDGDFDAEFETEDEAHEWFDSYESADED